MQGHIAFHSTLFTDLVIRRRTGESRPASLWCFREEPQAPGSPAEQDRQGWRVLPLLLRPRPPTYFQKTEFWLCFSVGSLNCKKSLGAGISFRLRADVQVSWRRQRPTQKVSAICGSSQLTPAPRDAVIPQEERGKAGFREAQGPRLRPCGWPGLPSPCCRMGTVAPHCKVVVRTT